MPNFKRAILIVTDSAGIGHCPRAKDFGDEGSNTYAHAAESVGGLKVPTMEKMGLGTLDDIPGVARKNSDQALAMRLYEASNGKDTMTGHWEMMGVYTPVAFKTFTDTGFPKELIEELEEKTGHKVIGNYASSGTEILKVLGEQQMRENSLIVYTSADSVLQIAAHEGTTGVEELYRCCEIAREICLRPEYKVGRVIARPFVGSSADDFKRTPNRHDYALSPSQITALDIMKQHGLRTGGIGKIGDIFNMAGITDSTHTVSNEDGMDKTIAAAKDKSWEGLVFTNLVEFDSEYGHRRNAVGYARALEAFDKRLQELIDIIDEDTIVMVTSDHGNDPTWTGTDHTRELVPLLIYSKKLKGGKTLEGHRSTFADIGATLLYNFGLEKPEIVTGNPIRELF